MRTVHVLVPEGVDDPERPSGGNTYDRRVCGDLAGTGWSVHERAVRGSWPWAGEDDRAGLRGAVAALPDGAVVLVDGLVASAVPDILVAECARLRLVVLLHMPLGAAVSADEPTRTGEAAVLSAAAAVVTTSAWTRRLLLDLYGLRPDRVHVAEPGVDPADLAPGTDDGGRLLCVAAVVPDKGHEVLLAALGALTDLAWRCVCVGSTSRDRRHVDRLLRQVERAGLSERVCLTGPRTGDDLAATYAASDALVLATRVESYGMVVVEALARGLPVVASAVGGVPEALGRLPDGSRPGLLVPPDDPRALAEAIRRWLADHDLRETLRQAARWRRTTLSGWSVTSGRVSSVLAEVAR